MLPLSLSIAASHAAEVVHAETEVGQDLFVRNPLAAVVVQPLLGFVDRALFFRADLFPIEHGFEQTGNGGKLRGRQPVNQLVDVLACRS